MSPSWPGPEIVSSPPTRNDLGRLLKTRGIRADIHRI
jgi:hypothetical protein